MHRAAIFHSKCYSSSLLSLKSQAAHSDLVLVLVHVFTARMVPSKCGKNAEHC